MSEKKIVTLHRKRAVAARSRSCSAARRDGRVVDCGGLENR